MKLPPYYLRRPEFRLDAATRAGFQRLFSQHVAGGMGDSIPYTLAAPKWQFLCYLADSQDVLLHGSGDASIREFEPRQAVDVSGFGNQRAVYAASDGIWPLFFAVVDKATFGCSLLNTCLHVPAGDGAGVEAFYFFSITETALRRGPWRAGTIYLLPRAGFVPQAPMIRGGVTIGPAQWASDSPVRPLAKLPVGPEDFPFLSQIRGHDDATTFARAAADPDGFPWLEGAY